MWPPRSSRIADTPRCDAGLRTFEEMLERMPLDELLVTIAEAAVILGVINN